MVHQIAYVFFYANALQRSIPWQQTQNVMDVINCTDIVQSLDIRKAMCYISICLDFPSNKLNSFFCYCRYDSEKIQVGNMEDYEVSEVKKKIQNNWISEI